MPKTKTGEQITWKEFGDRWKKGIEGITPFQRIKTQITGTRISLLGIFLGLCVSIYGWEKLWWVAIILLGAFITTGVQLLGSIQQRNSLKKHEDNCEEMDLDDFLEDDLKDNKEVNNNGNR